MEELNIWLDCIDDFDEKKHRLKEDYDEFVEGILDIPLPRSRELINIPDQWNQGICSYIWLTGAINLLNAVEDIKYEWKIVRDAINPIIKDDGIRYMTMRLETERKAGLIEWYLAIPKVWVKWQTKDNLIKQINIWLKTSPIYTGVSNCNWSMGWNDPIMNLTANKTNGHCLYIIDGDATYRSMGNLLEMPNSFGKKYGDNWYSYMKHDDVDHLMTSYIILDANNSQYFKLFKLKKQLEKIIDESRKWYDMAKYLQAKEIIDMFEKLGISKAIKPLIDKIK